MAEALVISYHSEVPEVDQYWLRIEQVVTDRSVAADDAAVLIDAIYQIDSCSGAIDPTADPAESAGLVGPLAAELFDTDYCHRDDRPATRVKIYRSHPQDDYVLRVMGAEASKPIATEEPVSLLLPIENAAYVILTKPVVDGYSATWRGAVSGGSGQVQPPEIRREGHLLYWDGQVSGALAVGYRSVADQVTITWPDASGDRAELLAFYHGAAVLEQVSPDPADDLVGSEQETACSKSSRSMIDELPGNCYEEASYYRVCQCSGRKEFSHTVLRDVPCPQSLVDEDGRHLVNRRDVNYYSDCRESDDVNTQEFYQERCCETVPRDLTLPLCRELTTDWSGTGVSEAYRQGLEQQYPAPSYALSIIPVGPPPGEPCGKSTFTQQRGLANCCDGVEPLIWNESATPDVLLHGQKIVGYISGGQVPYTYSTGTAGLYFATGRQRIVIDQPFVEIFADADFCGVGTVTVADGCSMATLELRSDLGVWEYIGPKCGLPGANVVAPDGSDGRWVSGTNVLISGKYKQLEVHQPILTQILEVPPPCGTPGTQECYECIGEAFTCPKGELLRAVHPAYINSPLCLNYPNNASTTPGVSGQLQKFCDDTATASYGGYFSTDWGSCGLGVISTYGWIYQVSIALYRWSCG